MSNIVVWSLLGSLILRALDSLGDLDLTLEVERMAERHPLVGYIEGELRRRFRPSGGLDCEELGFMIRDAMDRDREGLERLVYALVYAYARGRWGAWGSPCGLAIATEG